MLEKTSWNSMVNKFRDVCGLPKELLKLAFCFQGYCHVIQENLDTMSPNIKWRKRVSHHIVGFQMALEGRTVATTLVLTHISNGSLWKRKRTVHGQTGRGKSLLWFEALFRSSYEINSHKSEHGLFIILPNPRSLENLLMSTDFFIIIIIIMIMIIIVVVVVKESGC